MLPHTYTAAVKMVSEIMRCQLFLLHYGCSLESSTRWLRVALPFSFRNHLPSAPSLMQSIYLKKRRYALAKLVSSFSNRVSSFTVNPFSKACRTYADCLSIGNATMSGLSFVDVYVHSAHHFYDIQSTYPVSGKAALVFTGLENRFISSNISSTHWRIT